MRCEEIMKNDVQCVSPKDEVRAAAAKMRDENVGFLPVCDAQKKVIGTLTDRDLTTRILADGLPPTTPIHDVMSRDVIACKPSDDVQDAAQKMMDNQKSRIMCLDDDQCVVGVLSLSDVAQHVPQDQAARTLRGVTTREARA